jgi:hypothetical protein
MEQLAKVDAPEDDAARQDGGLDQRRFLSKEGLVAFTGHPLEVGPIHCTAHQGRPRVERTARPQNDLRFQRILNDWEIRVARGQPLAPGSAASANNGHEQVSRSWSSIDAFPPWLGAIHRCRRPRVAIHPRQPTRFAGSPRDAEGGHDAAQPMPSYFDRTNASTTRIL